MLRCEQELKPEERQLYLRIHELLSHMTLNSLHYGYISTGVVTRFVRHGNKSHGYIEFSRGSEPDFGQAYSIVVCFGMAW